MANSRVPKRLLGAPKWAKQLNHRKPNDLCPHIKSVAKVRLNYLHHVRKKKQVIKTKKIQHKQYIIARMLESIESAFLQIHAARGATMVATCFKDAELGLDASA